MKKLIYFIIILIVILLITLNFQNNGEKEKLVEDKDDFFIDDDYFFEDTGTYSVKYENGILEYSALVTKPTPCYEVDVQEFIMESYPVQVESLIEVSAPEPSDIMCIQVVDEELIERSLDIGHKPGNFGIKINEELVYSTNLKLDCNGMGLMEAKKTAIENCGELKENSFCNEGTNTWWIDLDLEKEGCNPACVVNVLDKSAEINWRCSGLI